MKVFFLGFVFFLFLHSTHSYSQINFDNELSAANPVKKGDTALEKQKSAIHQAYLRNAVETKNLQNQFYAHLYLLSDYLNKNEYEEATFQLFSADSLAQQSGNLSWLAAVHNRRGIIAFELNDAESAFKEYTLALEYCRKTNDTTCFAVNLEELAVTFHRLKKYDSAKHYFKLAIPFIRKATDYKKLYAYYNNYSNLLKDMGDFPGAKLYLDSTITAVMSDKDLLQQSSAKNNLAAFYIETGEYEKGFKILQECVTINKAQGWAEQLSFNYANLSNFFSKKGNYRAAYEYLQNYYSIDDSLKGAAMQAKMVNLAAGYEAQKKELVLKQSQLDLAITKRSLEEKIWLILLGLIAVGIGIWRWVAQANTAKKESVKSKQDLAELTRILLDKNTALSALEEKLITQQSDAAIDNTVSIEKTYLAKQEESTLITDRDYFEKGLYNQRILTHDDWKSFKLYFERAYPGFLLHLRNTHTEITEAEERMFLFIKLNLTSKESAAMLGISTDSIKKTRSRLRKRLNLGEEIDLDKYAKQFN